MTNQNTSSEKSHQGCYCPKCKVFVQDTKMEGLSLICPYCGAIL